MNYSNLYLTKWTIKRFIVLWLMHSYLPHNQFISTCIYYNDSQALIKNHIIMSPVRLLVRICVPLFVVQGAQI